MEPAEASTAKQPQNSPHKLKARFYLPIAWRIIAALIALAACLFVIAGVFSGAGDEAFVGIAFIALAITFICGLIVLAAIIGLMAGVYDRTYLAGSLVGALLLGAANLFVAVISALASAPIAPWGRPLRINGKMIHPELARGSSWAAGPQPNCDNLDLPTRTALATLWHHDAQKEHASVPAFSRVAWLLAGLGAPADLLAKTHHAGLQEIDHAQRCFALAGGYAGETLTVEPIPELLRAPLGLGNDPLLAVALESLRDGCLVEDFNADVAEQAAAHARDPAAKQLAQIIARDEREHAALAWEIVQWCIDIGGGKLRLALAKAGDKLPLDGPQAYGKADAQLVDRADPQAMIDHGRVPANQWPAIYLRRRQLTCERLASLLQRHQRAA